MSTSNNEEKRLQITTEVTEISACERAIKIVVPKNEVARYFDKEFEGIKDSVSIAGFRTGRVPRAIVRKKFGREISEQVKVNLVRDAISAVNEAVKLVPIGEPNIDVESIKVADDAPLEFTFTVEVRPDFDLTKWQELTIKRLEYELTQDDVDKALAAYIAEYGTLIPIDTPIESGNYIVADITAALDGEILTTHPNIAICVKPALSFRDGTIDNFGEIVKGKVVGDVISTKLNISNFAKNINARGKSIDVNFEIVGVKQLSAPSVSANLLQRIGNFKDVADLRDAVADTLQSQIEFERNLSIREQVSGLLPDAGWEFPEDFLAKQAEREIRRLEIELESCNFPTNAIAVRVNSMRQDIVDNTKKAIKEHFVLERIAEEESIQETEEDYLNEFNKIAKTQNVSPRKIRAQFEKRNEMEILRNHIIERKVIDKIASSEHAKAVKFKPTTFDVFAIDLAIAGEPLNINEASKEDLKEANKEIEAKRKNVN
ncbi:MAG: trigger factor [Planctomycetaceae bacterium]|jgi:trigger factor|nr:trigger factor [Planctomycetaceae bacterium]